MSRRAGKHRGVEDAGSLACNNASDDHLRRSGSSSRDRSQRVDEVRVDFLFVMAPSSQELEPPAIPGRFTSRVYGGLGGAEGIRTPDLCSAIAALSHLSYSPGRRAVYVRLGRVSTPSAIADRDRGCGLEWECARFWMSSFWC